MKDFSFDTVQDFDQHIRQSIPGFDVLVQQVAILATNFIVPKGRVVDLGCSTGALLTSLYAQTPSDFRTRFTGYDLSENLLPVVPPLGVHSLRQTGIEFIKEDITKADFGSQSSCLVLSLFTLQFLGMAEKRAVVRRAFRALVPGGAFIVAEKNLMGEGMVQELFTYSLSDYKAQQGFSPENILEKQKSLRHQMRPARESDNVALFQSAGFQVIESFYQALAFKAWICIKTVSPPPNPNSYTATA